jgi:predicted small lipoprotein YifL
MIHTLRQRREMMPALQKAVVLAVAIAACGCGGRAEEPAAASPADPRADEAQNIRFVGHNDLQGRESLLVAVRSD